MKRLSRVLLAASLPAILAALPAAQAQEDPIATCQRAPNAEARIACLEAALRQQSAAPAEAARSPQASEAEPRGQDTGQSTLGRVGGLIGAINPFSGGESGERAGTVSSQDAAADRFGAAQVAARTASRSPDTPSEQLAARIAAVSVVPYQRLELTLDNGQVWRQIAGDRQRISERHASGNTVNIWETRLGGYQMRLNEIARTIRVERIR